MSFTATRRRSTACRLESAKATLSRSSARTAPARRRSSAPLPECSGRRADASSFRDTDITGWESFRVCNLGIGQVAEGRQIFPTLTVAENFDTGAMLARARGQRGRIVTATRVVPGPGGTVRASGGNAVGRRATDAGDRALPDGRRPNFVMFDEPSLGLAPAIVQHVLRTIRDLNGEGLTCVLVEQKSRSRSSSPCRPTCSKTAGSRCAGRANNCWRTTACDGPTSGCERYQ